MKEQNKPGCKWMSCVDGTKSISKINIPGTHDSGTQFISSNPSHYRCQKMSIGEQLEIGVRYFDIRCCAREKGKSPLIKHSNAFCLKAEGNAEGDNLLTLDDVLETVGKFLGSYGSETILLQIKNEGGNDGLLVDYLAPVIERNGFIWSEDRLPALCEVRGKAVLIRRFTYGKNASGLTEKDFGINLSSWDTECHARSKAASNTYVYVNERAYVQDRYNISGGPKYDLILRAIEEANNKDRGPFDGWDINLTSCTIHTPESAAEAINKRLMDEPLLCKKNKLGTFVMDFVDEELVRRVYLTNEEVVSAGCELLQK